jgi:Transposase
MGTSHPHLVRTLEWAGRANPTRIPTAGGVLIDHEAVALIGGQGCSSMGRRPTHHTSEEECFLSNPLLVGVDVHRATNTVCLMHRQGREVARRFTVANNRPGTDTCIRHLAQQIEDGDFDAMHIAAEATGWYGWHFFQTLDQALRLQPGPVALYPFHPRLTANCKKTSVDLDHADPMDAFVIADRLRLGRDLPPPFPYEAHSFPVRCLTRYRSHVVHA